MKTETKEYWVSVQCVNDLKNKDLDGYYFSKSPCGSFKNKITITYEIPEKKIEISESEFDELFKSVAVVKFKDSWCATPEYFKQKLFGDK